MFNKITCAAVLEHFLQGESKKKTSEDWLKLCVQHFRRVVLSRLVSIDRMQADFPLFSGHVSSAVRDFKDTCYAICFLILLQTNPPVVFRAASTDDSSRNDPKLKLASFSPFCCSFPAQSGSKTLLFPEPTRVGRALGTRFDHRHDCACSDFQPMRLRSETLYPRAPRSRSAGQG